MSISISLEFIVDLCILWGGWLATLSFLCPLLLIGFIKLKELFLKTNYWDAFKEKYQDELRAVEVHEVEKMVKCRELSNGYKTYKCPKCGFTRQIPFNCKSRLCSNCGKYSTDRWTHILEKKLLPVTHRHMVFTISDKLWPFVKQNRYLLGSIFKAVKRTIDRLVHDRYPTDLIKVGLICALHTSGKNLKFNTHIHVIVSEGGLNKKKEWVDYKYFPYDKLRHIWKYEVLTGLKKDYIPRNSSDSQKFYAIIEDLFSDHTLDFYVRAKDRLYHGKGLVKYIIRYIRHPPIAEYRIARLEGNQVTFWYDQKEGETEQKKRYYVTMELEEFIWALLQHIPDRLFRMLRFYGLYSNRLRKIAKAAIVLKDTLASYQEIGVQIATIERLEAEAMHTEKLRKRPILCPHCKIEMELIEIYIPPSKPPPNPMTQTKLIQERPVQDRISLVQDIISKNHRYYPKGIPLRIILEDASQYGVPEHLCKRIVDYLVHKGYIYLPQLKYYLPVT